MITRILLAGLFFWTTTLPCLAEEPSPKDKDVSFQEQWYRSLANDNAVPDEWVKAATKIVEFVDTEQGFSFNPGMVWPTAPNSKPYTRPMMKGESLRAKSNPSVSALILRRMDAISKEPDDVGVNHLILASRFALALADWDGKAHIEELRQFSEVMRQRQVSQKMNRSYLVGPMCALYEKRFGFGDQRALKEYADWLVTRSPAAGDVGPLWRHPDNPDINEAAQKMFGAPHTGWTPLVPSRYPGLDALELFTSPMIGVAAFRTELLRGLGDTQPAGTVTINDEKTQYFGVDGGWGTTTKGPFLDPLAPAVGKVTTFRFCDLYGYELSEVEGFPKCQVYWPTKEKDTAIAACVRFLQQYGHCYSYRRNQPVQDHAYFHIQPLGRPATPQDVKDGLAIFSLAGRSRSVDSLHLPLTALWTTLKDRPYEIEDPGPDGSVKKSIWYDTEGRVCQAEEVFADGKWQRFYGYVGPYRLDKVAASEIEFPPPYGWWQFAQGWDYQVSGPNVIIKDDQVGSTTKLGMNSVLPVTVIIRNGSGLDQRVPPQWVQPEGDSKHLPAGASISLSYSPLVLDKPTDPPPGITWEKTELLPSVFAASKPGRSKTLKPTKQVAILQVDLRDFAKFTRPGTYLLKVEFSADGASRKASAQTMFTIYGR